MDAPPDHLKAGPDEDPPDFDALACIKAIVRPDQHPEQTDCDCERRSE